MSRVIIRDITSENEAASMIGYVTMGMSIIPLFAPGLGGLIQMLLGWPSIFLIMSLLGLLLLLLVFRDLGETKIIKKTKIQNLQLHLLIYSGKLNFGDIHLLLHFLQELSFLFRWSTLCSNKSI